MFYHALTGNGGTAPTENLEPVLLWTNPSPNSNFAAQTVSLDLTDYSGVIVEFNKSDSSQILATRVYAKKTDDFSIFGCGYIADTAIARNILAVNDTGVQFGTVSTGTTVCIPSKIYGVKDYVVEPIDSISISQAKEFTTAGIDCQIGEYYQLISNNENQSFNGFSGADILIKFASSGAFAIICKTTSTHINVGSITSGAYCQIILNK